MRLDFWIIFCIFFHLSACAFSHPVLVGKIANQQAIDVRQRTNHDHCSFLALNETIPRSNSNDDQLLNRSLVSNSLGMTHLLFFTNTVIFLFSWRNPLLLRKYEKNDYQLLRGEVYRLMTSIFLHVDFQHLLINNISLSRVGSEVSPFSLTFAPIQ